MNLIIMRKLFFLPAILFFGLIACNQTLDEADMFKKISDEVMSNGEAYDILYDLTKNIGNRVSGSTGYDKAVEWGAEELRRAGADKVWLQPVIVPAFERGKESLKIKIGNQAWNEVKMLTLGNSIGTDGKDLTAEIIVVNNFDEFEALSEEEVKGKIILFNYPFDQSFINTLEGYGDAVRYRFATPPVVAQKGGVAVFIRSITTAFDDAPHTGGTSYRGSDIKIPAVALGAETAQRIADAAKTTKVTATLNSNAKMNEDHLTYNVIGEITGTKDEQVIVVGGHLDSWDVGEGAHDNGTGVTQAIEVIRTFKNLNIQPNHTIRAVLFANEENGGRGGRVYADTLEAKQEPHVFALESDLGGFTPRGFNLDLSPEKEKEVRSWLPLFKPYGAAVFNNGSAGVDVSKMKKHGVELAGLAPDSQRYFDIHHSESDVFEAVNRREHLLGATVMTQLIYMVDKYW
ncbi:MAG: M20/M25/M40 family metallo-hydrolase [Balneolaceae bacterium]